MKSVAETKGTDFPHSWSSGGESIAAEAVDFKCFYQFKEQFEKLGRGGEDTSAVKNKNTLLALAPEVCKTQNSGFWEDIVEAVYLCVCSVTIFSHFF